MTGPACIIIPPAIDIEAAERIEQLESELAKAKRLLVRSGFEDKGGLEWKPPLGPAPFWHDVKEPPSDYRQLVGLLKRRRWNSRPVYQVVRYFPTQPGIHDGEPGWCDNEGFFAGPAGCSCTGTNSLR